MVISIKYSLGIKLKIQVICNLSKVQFSVDNTKSLKRKLSLFHTSYAAKRYESPSTQKTSSGTGTGVHGISSP